MIDKPYREGMRWIMRSERGGMAGVIARRRHRSAPNVVSLTRCVGCTTWGPRDETTLQYAALVRVKRSQYPSTNEADNDEAFDKDGVSVNDDDAWQASETTALVFSLCLSQSKPLDILSIESGQKTGQESACFPEMQVEMQARRLGGVAGRLDLVVCAQSKISA